MSLNTFPCNPYPISTEELNKGNNDDLNTRVSALESAVEEIDNDKADLGVIAAEFDAESGVYAVGDLVMYQGKLYEFTTAHETAGDWDSTEVTEKTVSDEIDTVKNGLNNLVKVQQTTPYFDQGSTYVQMPGYVLVAAFETAASWNGITILNVQGGGGAVISNSNFSGNVEVTLIWLKI